MIHPSEGWTPFSSEQEKLDYLKQHKLTPPSFDAPKQLFYDGAYCSDVCECSVVGFDGATTTVIQIGSELHCIHPDYLLEMQMGKSKKSKGTLLPDNCDFIAIDFETATKDLRSACEIGIAFVSNLQVVGQYHSMIRPPRNQYDSYNSAIHNIVPEDTEDAPSFSELWKDLKTLLGPVPVVAHSAGFDMGVLRACIGKKKCDNFVFADTLKMVRDIVPGQHGLEPCCAYFGIDLHDHHNAEADAVACAEIAIACIKTSAHRTLTAFCNDKGIPLTSFLQEQKNVESIGNTEKPKTKKRSFPSKTIHISEIKPTVETIDENNPLYGKNVVFTGDLSIDRATAMQLTVNAGGIIKSTVSRKTNYLVVGTQDPTLVGSDGMSAKERKAHELLNSGLNTLTIITESVFLELVGVGGMLAHV